MLSALGGGFCGGLLKAGEMRKRYERRERGEVCNAAGAFPYHIRNYIYEN